jgi:hypothetical protein
MIVFINSATWMERMDFMCKIEKVERDAFPGKTTRIKKAHQHQNQ